MKIGDYLHCFMKIEEIIFILEKGDLFRVNRVKEGLRRINRKLVRE